MTTDQLFKQYNSTAEDHKVPAPFLDIEKAEVTKNELSLDDNSDAARQKMKDFVEEYVSSEENDNFKESDGNWENWDDGE